MLFSIQKFVKFISKFCSKEGITDLRTADRDLHSGETALDMLSTISVQLWGKIDNFYTYNALIFVYIKWKVYKNQWKTN